MDHLPLVVDDGIWQRIGGDFALASLADAHLTAYARVMGGFVWSVQATLPRDVPHPVVFWHEVISEDLPYPTLDAAMAACENYYAREFHGEQL